MDIIGWGWYSVLMLAGHSLMYFNVFKGYIEFVKQIIKSY